MGLIIVSGMLVDDAVVVSDNVSRHMEEGKDPEDAAVIGAQQIWPAVTASILTTVCKYLDFRNLFDNSYSFASLLENN